MAEERIYGLVEGDLDEVNIDYVITDNPNDNEHRFASLPIIN